MKSVLIVWRPIRGNFRVCIFTDSHDSSSYIHRTVHASIKTSSSNNYRTYIFTFSLHSICIRMRINSVHCDHTSMMVWYIRAYCHTPIVLFSFTHRHEQRLCVVCVLSFEWCTSTCNYMYFYDDVRKMQFKTNRNIWEKIEITTTTSYKIRKLNDKHLADWGTAMGTQYVVWNLDINYKVTVYHLKSDLWDNDNNLYQTTIGCYKNGHGDFCAGIIAMNR